MKLFRERDVNYTFDKVHAVELGYGSFRYEVWSTGVLICLDAVYCRSQKDFETLLEHWSRGARWKYKEAPKKQEE